MSGRIPDAGYPNMPIEVYDEEVLNNLLYEMVKCPNRCEVMKGILR